MKDILYLAFYLSTRTYPAQCPGLYNCGDKNNTPSANLSGFSPQLSLDDIIDTANNAVQDGVNGIEEFLQNGPMKGLPKHNHHLEGILTRMKLFAFWNTIWISRLISLRRGV